MSTTCVVLGDLRVPQSISLTPCSDAAPSGRLQHDDVGTARDVRYRVDVRDPGRRAIGTRGVSEYNLYVEDIATGEVKALTSNGSRKLINGTFDWAYEEEFSCRDGFRWSPDSKKLAYWQIDAKNTKDYDMLNTTEFHIP